MPLYEYSCPSCGKRFEELVRAAEADKVRCPACQTKAARQLSSFAVAVAADKSSGGAPASCQGCPSSGGGSCPYK